MKRLVLCIFVFAPACGGEAQSAAPARPPPPEVLGLALRVAAAEGDDTFCPALEVGLARSNLTVTSDAAQPADATITCRAFASQDTGFFRVTVNGESKMKFTVRVEIRATQSNTVVDQFIADYTGYRGRAPDEDVVGKIVTAFAYSPRIAAFARAVKISGGTAVVTAQPTVTATATEQVPPQDRRDDADWFAIDTVKCKIPARVEACDGVRRYLQRHPGGAHAQEANAILAAAQPALEKLQKDEVAWQKAGRSECASKRTSDACVGVEAYEIQFPTGVHSDDAHRMLKAAGVDK